MVIPELVFLAVVFVLAVVALLLLSEDERLEDLSERRRINALADQSRKRKAPGMRPRCRYIKAGLQK